MPRPLSAFLTLLGVLFVTVAPAAAESLKILALGTSLTSGFGLPYDQGFTAQLEKALAEKGHDVDIIDGGVSGDTTAGARARLEWMLAEPVDGVIVELGANDALRGLDPQEAEFNLDAILRALRARHLPVLLTGMRAPPNMGAGYAQAFEAIFPRLAVQYDTIFYPFFLDGVAGDAKLNQDDGIHPNADGVARIVSGILPAAEQLIQTIETAKPSQGQ